MSLLSIVKFQEKACCLKTWELYPSQTKTKTMIITAKTMLPNRFGSTTYNYKYRYISFWIDEIDIYFEKKNGRNGDARVEEVA